VVTGATGKRRVSPTGEVKNLRKEGEEGKESYCELEIVERGGGTEAG